MQCIIIRMRHEKKMLSCGHFELPSTSKCVQCLCINYIITISPLSLTSNKNK